MIWVEALAALLVGMALTALVVSPLVSSRPVVAELDDEPEEFDQTPKGIALAALEGDRVRPRHRQAVRGRLPVPQDQVLGAGARGHQGGGSAGGGGSGCAPASPWMRSRPTSSR